MYGANILSFSKPLLPLPSDHVRCLSMFPQVSYLVTVEFLVTVDNTREQDIRGIGEGEEHGLHESQPGQTWDGATPPYGCRYLCKDPSREFFHFSGQAWET